VNHISSAMVCLGLLPIMVDSATKHGGRPRIVQLGSNMHHTAKFDKEVLNSQRMLEKLSDKAYCSRRGYATSSLFDPAGS
jgi:retinol dehydrogenase 12